MTEGLKLYRVTGESIESHAKRVLHVTVLATDEVEAAKLARERVMQEDDFASVTLDITLLSDVPTASGVVNFEIV
jgi:hypothetical protein